VVYPDFRAQHNCVAISHSIWLKLSLATGVFELGPAGGAPAPDRVEWRFTLQPYAGGEVRSLVPADMDDDTFGVHRPITIEARLYLNGEYQRFVKGKAMIQGGPDDPDLAAAVACLTQSLLSPSRGSKRPLPTGSHLCSSG
jgi:hypothetical protein